MQQGYLYIEETGREGARYHLGMGLGQPPWTDVDKPLYIAGFQDIDAAYMHVSGSLRHLCRDREQQLYATDLPTLIAHIEADELPARRLWLRPALDAATERELGRQTTGLRRRQLNRDLVWRLVGYLGILLLILLSLL